MVFVLQYVAIHVQLVMPIMLNRALLVWLVSLSIWEQNLVINHHVQMDSVKSAHLELSTKVQNVPNALLKIVQDVLL